MFWIERFLDSAHDLQHSRRSILSQIAAFHQTDTVFSRDYPATSDSIIVDGFSYRSLLLTPVRQLFSDSAVFDRVMQNMGVNVAVCCVPVGR